MSPKVNLRAAPLRLAVEWRYERVIEPVFSRFGGQDVSAVSDGKAANPSAPHTPEPWLRGTLTEIPAAPRAVLHALELALEDIAKWCSDLTDAEMNARPGGIAPLAFHLRHIARSTDRLLTYAEGRQLTPQQLGAMKAELDAGAEKSRVMSEFDDGITSASARIRTLSGLNLEEPRKVGRKELPTTVGGLLVHVAEHTLRHVGQAITTAKIVKAARG